MSTSRKAFVTTLNTDNYLPGVLVLDKTIRDMCSHRLFVLVSHGLEESTYEALRRRDINYGFADDIVVDPEVFADIDSDFTHWKNTLFKLRIFELTQFDKIVFIDSDIMVIQPIDELFDRPDMSAVIAGRSYPGNEGWHDLGSGVVVLEPRDGIVEQLVDLVPAVSAEKQNFGDQDVIIKYFSDWPQNESLHLPEKYNVFFDHYGFYFKHGGVKAVHFIGKKKPWMMTRGQVFVGGFLRCIVKGNARGIGMLMRYRRYLREVGADG